MMKEIGIIVCNRKDKPQVWKYIVEEKKMDLLIESLSHDLREQGFYIDDVIIYDKKIKKRGKLSYIG